MLSTARAPPGRHGSRPPPRLPPPCVAAIPGSHRACRGPCGRGASTACRSAGFGARAPPLLRETAEGNQGTRLRAAGRRDATAQSRTDRSWRGARRRGGRRRSPRGRSGRGAWPGAGRTNETRAWRWRRARRSIRPARGSRSGKQGGRRGKQGGPSGPSGPAVPGPLGIEQGQKGAAPRSVARTAVSPPPPHLCPHSLSASLPSLSSSLYPATG